MSSFSKLGLVALLALPVAAQAYVPPSFFVVRMLARKHAAFDNGRFHNKLTFYKSNGEVAHVLNETLQLSDAEHATVRLSDSSGAALAQHARVLIGARPGDADRPLSYDLEFIKDGANIYDHFKNLGLPLKTETALYSEKEGNLPYKPEPTVNLERFENKVAVVVGDRSKKSDVYSSISLWVEKDSFLPLRAIFPTAPETGLSPEPLEYRLSGYSVYRNFLYPRTVQIFRNGTLWVKIEAQDVRPASGALEEPKAKAEPEGDLKDFIETYFKWVR